MPQEVLTIKVRIQLETTDGTLFEGTTELTQTSIKDTKMLSKQRPQEALKSSPLPIDKEDMDYLAPRIASFGRKLSGRRLALELADFITAHKNLESFDYAYIEKLYRALLKAKLSLPIVRSIPQLVRDTCNQSEWFEKGNNGYIISAAGYRELANDTT